MKKIAMIPALLNSKRVPNKNLMLVDGYPLMYYVVKSCKESGIFDDIYINSDERIFEQMANELEVKFYHRKKENGGSSCEMKNNSRDCQGTRCSVHDHFLYDFITNIECDYLIQIHTTSPMLEPVTIKNFTETLIKKYDSLVTIEETFSESFISGEPINFDINKKQPTQTLDPIQSISWALTGWKKDSFIDEYESGPTFCGKLGLYPISKIEAIDVDTMDELYIAEACLSHKKRKDNIGKWFYSENILSIESELRDLISLDGSPMPTDKVLGHNEMIMNLDTIEEKIGNDDSTWCYPVVYTDNDQIAFIKQRKGEGCRKHFHPTKDEWWVIFRGTFEYKLWYNAESIGEPDKIIIANEGDIVFLEKGTIHIITCISDEPGTRLACGEKSMSHVYVK